MTLYLTREQWIDMQDFLGLPDPPTEEECEEQRKREDEVTFWLLEEAAKDPGPITRESLASLLGIVEK